jgi:hypothetical protein
MEAVRSELREGFLNEFLPKNCFNIFMKNFFNEFLEKK